MNIQFLIPTLNESENIDSLLDYIQQIASLVESKVGGKLNWSTLFADNSSTDSTIESIKQVFVPAIETTVIAFRENFGFHFSSSYLFVHSEADLAVLIPADMQIPTSPIVEGIASAIATSRSVLLCRRRAPQKKRSKLMKIIKDIFYSTLKQFQGDVIPGYFGMGIYTFEDRAFAHTLKEFSFEPFQVRLVIPRVLINPHVLWFDEHIRKAGRSSFGLSGYLREGLSIIARSRSVQKSGIQVVLLSTMIATILMSILIFATKIIWPQYILPGFTTLSLIILACTNLNLLGLYLLALRLDGNTSQLQSIIAYARRKRI